MISVLTKAVALVAAALLITILSTAVRSQPGPGVLSMSNRWISTRDADASRTELSNWLDVMYRYDSCRGGFRLEGHDPNLSSSRGDRFSQRFLEFSDSGIKIRAGNFYERLGRVSFSTPTKSRIRSSAGSSRRCRSTGTSMASTPNSR